jgi:hypothetical protein
MMVNHEIMTSKEQRNESVTRLLRYSYGGPVGFTCSLDAAATVRSALNCPVHIYEVANAMNSELTAEPMHAALEKKSSRRTLA